MCGRLVDVSSPSLCVHVQSDRAVFLTLRLLSSVKETDTQCLFLLRLCLRCCHIRLESWNKKEKKKQEKLLKKKKINVCDFLKGVFNS